MSFIKEAASEMKIGAVKIDTILDKDKYMPGEKVTGKIIFYGKDVDLEIENVYIHFKTTFVKADENESFTMPAKVDSFKVLDKLTIKPGETSEERISFDIPYDTPLSFGETKIWIITGADIKNAIDPKDKDFINIVPSKLQEKVLNTIKEIGFDYHKIECKAKPHNAPGRFIFFQEFEMQATSEEYTEKLDKLEFTFLETSTNTLKILMQVNKKGKDTKLFTKSFDMDKNKFIIEINNPDEETIKNHIKNAIDAHI